MIQKKTEKHAEAAHFKIKISEPLQAIINRCRLPDFITKQLKKARDKSNLSVKARLGSHEIGSLGSKLYKDAGVDPQALLGHTSAKMTKHYLDGHGLQWTEVCAGLAALTK